MSDNGNEKPFAPSEHKLRQSRERGEIPSIKDLPQVLAALVLCLLLMAAAPWLWKQGHAMTETLIDLSVRATSDPRSLILACRLVAELVVMVCAGSLLTVAITGTLSKWLINGPVFSFDPVSPKLSRINPAEGFKRLFSQATWVAFFKALFSAILVAAALGYWVRTIAREALRSSEPVAAVVTSLGLLASEVLIACLILSLVAILDLMYQRWSFARRLRMDHKDLTDEHKQLEGSPEVKSARRQEHQKLSNQRQ